MHPRYFDFLESQIASVSDVSVRGALTRVAKLHRNILETTANVRSNKDLSAQGRTKEARASLGKHAADLIRANATAQRLAARIEEKRAKIQLPAIDKTDAAGAALRSQVRDRLNGKSAQELRALAPTMSPLYTQAILEAPELVGADRDTVDAVRTRAIDLIHPGRTAELDAARDAVRLLASATAEISNAARDLAELPNASALVEFLNQAVPDQRHIEAEIERETALAA